MDNAKISSIVVALRDEESRLLKTHRDLAASVQQIENDLTSVRRALRSLGEKAANPTADPNRKPAASQDEVANMLVAILKKRGTVPEVTLKELVETEVTAAGKSRLGLSRRLQESLARPCFKRTAEGYQLVDITQEKKSK